ncbi:2-hydroxy-3-oxopropionate reductase [Streptomyces sp. HUAS TT7]|uniref:2-hydroxy-3-oxopropionate reductase n=1 Tax=Streptomyces sp. HUAS TT7 TaxID=3447507 RepID=UPI003F65B65B
MRIGFIGLGIMGGPMAANLVRAGFDVIGYNRSPAAVERLVVAGGTRAHSIKEVTASADIVITMLPDSLDVEDVVLGTDGVLAASSPGQVLIDMSTIRPQSAIAIARAAKDKGVLALDAPVSGGERGAIDGELSIMAGGEPAVFEAVLPVLEAMGTTVVRVGPHGAGQTVKAVNQFLVAGIIELVAEAILLLEATDTDVDAGLRVLRGGLAGNRILDRKGAAMLAREFTPGFRVDLHHKDLGIGLSIARDAGVTVPVGALVAQLLAAVRARGDGRLDHTALLRLLEQLSRPQPDPAPNSLTEQTS